MCQNNSRNYQLLMKMDSGSITFFSKDIMFVYQQEVQTRENQLRAVLIDEGAILLTCSKLRSKGHEELNKSSFLPVCIKKVAAFMLYRQIEGP